MHPFPLSRRNFLALSGTALGTCAAGLRLPLARCAEEPTKAQQEIAGAINGFATDLYRRVAGGEGKDRGNLFLSPFSIETALGMTSAGARGKTLEEMEKVLHLPKDPHPAFGELLGRFNATAIDKKRPYELSVANAIWAQQGFPWEKAFTDLTRKHYGTGTVEVDFAASEAARKLINEWVEKETKERIKELIGPGIITALTRMVLANAIYFRSNWLYQFDKTNTKDTPFTRTDGTKADVPLMSQRGKFNYGEITMFVLRAGEKVQVLELPYAGRELSMLVFLPESPDAVNRLAQWLTPELLSKPKLIARDTKVSLPRFKIESEYGLKPVLMDLGMKAAFGAADFTGMSPKGKELSITHVLHKAFVEVNEIGTEAAAATAVVIGKGAAPKSVEFRADRPFVFAIRDNATGAALFLGRYAGPKV